MALRIDHRARSFKVVCVILRGLSFGPRVAVLLLVTIEAGTSAAEESIRLQALYRQGEIYDIRSHVAIRYSGHIERQTVSVVHEVTKEYREKIVGIGQGRPTKVTRKYLVFEKTTRQRVGNEESPTTTHHASTIVGKELTLSRHGGEVRVEGAPSTAQRLRAEDLALGVWADVFLPSEHVRVGDSWKVSPQRIRSFLGGTLEEECDATCALTEVAGGMARVSVRLKLTTAREMRVSVALEGSLLFDVNTQRVSSLSLKGPRELVDRETRLRGSAEAKLVIATKEARK